MEAGDPAADRGRDRRQRGHLTARIGFPLHGLPVSPVAERGRVVIAHGPDREKLREDGPLGAELAADRRFTALRDPAVFTSVLRTLPVFAAWLDGLDPITGVFPMAGLHNTLRRLVDGGGPVVTGLLAAGDSVCTTNPTLGRGLSLAISGAAQLTDAIAAQGESWPDLALTLDAQIAEHVVPYYEDQAELDAGRLAALRHNVFGGPAPQPPGLTRAGSRTASCGSPRRSIRRRSAACGASTA